MPSSSNGERQYRLALSGEIAKSLGRFQYQESLEGRGEQFLQALRTVIEGLVHHPRKLGEPLYHLNALRLQVRSVAVSPLLIHFAIHDDYPLVFIKSVALLPK
jgi:hypothetical protein